MSYGFEKAKKPSIAPAEPEPRKLDLAGLTVSPPIEVTPAEDRAAVAAGERLGFVARDALPPSFPGEVAATSPTAPVRIARARQAIPAKSILVKGPESVIDRFIAYTNERKARSYWEVLDELLKGQGR